MDSGFETLDYIIFAVYVAIIVAVGLYLSRGSKGKERSGEDYFLAGRNLTWWAIGASLIAANISAEHFIGMSGSGYALGLGIAAYEWMAAITLILVGSYFLPIFLQKGIYTTNQFLAGRFNQGVSSAFAIMWLLVYVFINLTSVTYLGSKAIEEVMLSGITLKGTGFEWAYNMYYSIEGELGGIANQVMAALKDKEGVDIGSIALNEVYAKQIVASAQALGEGVSKEAIVESLSSMMESDATFNGQIMEMANESADVKGKTLLGILALGFFSALYSIYGGLTAVAWTDVIQVIFLIGGGLFTTYIVLDFVSDGSVFKGFGKIVDGASDHFNMIFEKGETMIPNGKGGKKDAFIDLPGLAVVFGAMWLTNLGYWGFNQYIIQKGLAAKSMKEARQGLVFAGFLKILVPLVVVIPGIAAYYILNTDDPYILQGLTEKFGSLDNVGQLEKSDSAYPWLLRNFIPVGIRGLAFAALVAAIISSLASMINSTSTIFTIDIYKPLINKNASEKQLVRIGRIVAFVALIISSLVAQPLLGGFDQVFQYIQEYTGLIYPGVAVVFSMGLFWKRASTSAAIAAALCTFPFGFGAKFLFPGMPFLLRMGYVFIALVAVASLFIFFDKKGEVEETEETKLSEGIVKMMLGASRIFAGVSVVSLLLAIASLTNIAGLGSLLNIGGEAFMFFGSAMAMIGVVLYTNALGKTADSKAIRYTPELFKSDLFFNLGSLGIILIVGALYVIFW